MLIIPYSAGNTNSPVCYVGYGENFLCGHVKCLNILAFEVDDTQYNL